MKTLRQLATFLLVILRTLLFGWLLALLELIRAAFRRLRACLDRCRLPGRLKKTATSRCIKVSDPAFKRPDPMIYDQYYLMGQGIAVTWDNPDIHLEQGGVPVPPHSLKPDTVYDIVARIWNNSTEAPVVGLPVDFSYLSFGNGTQTHTVGQQKVSLGVKGGPNHPAFAKMAWHTPSTPGHYCVQVSFDWIDDVNPNNNLGQTNTDVVAAHSPAEILFQLRNDGRQRREFRFEADGYTIPPPSPCGEKPPTPPADGGGTRLAPGTVTAVPARHSRRNATLPEGWTVSFAPASPSLAPGEEITVRTTADPPASFHGRQPINVHAFHAEGLAGGITAYVDVP
jgi:hypothetical protein